MHPVFITDGAGGFLRKPPLCITNPIEISHISPERVFSAAGKMHGDLQKSAKDSTLEHSLFAVPRARQGRLQRARDGCGMYCGQSGTGSRLYCAHISPCGHAEQNHTGFCNTPVCNAYRVRLCSMAVLAFGRAIASAHSKE